MKAIIELEKTGISGQVLKEIGELAKLHHISKVVLFGSRARGDFHPKSDIDLAIMGGDVTGFSLDVEDRTETLLQYDVVDMGKVQEELLKNINRDGVILYEEI